MPDSHQGPESGAGSVTIREFQDFILNQYGKRDAERGTPGTFLWFIEEVGELATALAGDDQANKEEEFADVLAWLNTLANINGVDLTAAVEKYTVKGVEGTK
jgi:NTP pyrophosphatase (non-canonical NTP hydrolase)